MIKQADVRALRAELLAAGVYERSEGTTWLRLAGLVVATLGCLAGVTVLPWWSALVLLPAAALLLTTAAMLGHEGCHGSFSDRPWQNQAIATVTFPLLSGLGVLYWTHKHNVRHHGYPNVMGQDLDIEMWPMAMCQEEYEASGPVRRLFQRHLQAYAFWPLTLFLPVVMRTPSITFLLQHAKKRGVDRALVLDAGALIIHYALWLGLGAAVWGLWQALVIYVVTWSIVGVLLAMIFAPAHMGLPIHTEERKGWLHQLETTRNLKVPRGFKWFFVGLDYQVEHHLFPKIAHRKLPLTRDIVRAWCQKNGYPHHEIGYGDALVSVTRSMRDAWKTPAGEQYEVEAVRPAA